MQSTRPSNQPAFNQKYYVNPKSVGQVLNINASSRQSQAQELLESQNYVDTHDMSQQAMFTYDYSDAPGMPIMGTPMGESLDLPPVPFYPNQGEPQDYPELISGSPMAEMPIMGGAPMLHLSMDTIQDEINVKKSQQYTRAQEEFIYEKIMFLHNIPGVKIVMAYQGEILDDDELLGHSNVKKNRASSTSNYHRVSSVSKAVTRACLDVLKARGKLNFNQLVFKDFLTEFEIQKNPRLAKVTVQHLIDHRVGIWNTTAACPLQSSDHKHSVYEVIQMTIDSLKWHLNVDPGQSFLYSDFGYCLLGRVIERITEKTYIDFVREEFNVDCKLAGKTYDQLLPNEKDYYNQNERLIENMKLARMDSCAGLLFKPRELVKLATQIQGNVYQRGSIEGAESLLIKIGDWTMVAFSNKKNTYVSALAFEDVFEQFTTEFVCSIQFNNL